MRHVVWGRLRLAPLSVVLFPFAAAALIALMVGLPAAASAQEVDAKTLSRGKRAFKTGAFCANCHGWAGDGQGNPRAPNGPSLRITELDRESLIEVIACGRPGAEMPYHDRRAYSDERCYGATADDFGKDVPPPGRYIARRDIEAVADYILVKVKGLGEVTKDECIDYWGPTARICARYN